MSDARTSRLVIDRGGGRAFNALGAHVERLVHPRTTGSDRIGVSLCVMQPGDEILTHRHPYEEAYYVVEGEGRMTMAGEDPIALVPGRAIYVPGNRIHGQVNTGNTPLVIVCSLSPPPVEGEAPDFQPLDEADQ